MRINRVFKGLAFALVLACGGLLPAAAQDAAPRTVAVEPWQAAITGQVEAFRTRNATAAFGYAAAAFHTAFPSAEAFFSAIIGSGYAPIMESRSHSFGRFEKQGDKTVLQEVKFVGTDQSLYAAYYQLIEEPEGWRVTGVQLQKQPGLAI